jgi:hypothetical protein
MAGRVAFHEAFDGGEDDTGNFYNFAVDPGVCG